MSIPISEVISHWSHYFKSFSISAIDFYGELGKICAVRDMPHTVIEAVEHNEGGLFSAKRQYLRIRYNKLVFDVCAAPFGKDFFVSWWLYETEGFFTNLFRGTKLGSFLKRRESLRTFFRVDEEEMFRSCVHECILEAIENMTNGKANWQLTSEEKAYTIGKAYA